MDVPACSGQIGSPARAFVWSRKFFQGLLPRLRASGRVQSSASLGCRCILGWDSRLFRGSLIALPGTRRREKSICRLWPGRWFERQVGVGEASRPSASLTGPLPPQIIFESLLHPDPHSTSNTKKSSVQTSNSPSAHALNPWRRGMETLELKSL